VGCMHENVSFHFQFPTSEEPLGAFRIGLSNWAAKKCAIVRSVCIETYPVRLRCDIPVVLVKITKLNSRRLKVKTQLYYINQLHVSASNRPSLGCTSNPFSLDVQPDNGLLEAETYSWLAVTIICCFDFQASAVYFCDLILYVLQ